MTGSTRQNGDMAASRQGGGATVDGQQGDATVTRQGGTVDRTTTLDEYADQYTNSYQTAGGPQNGTLTASTQH